MEDYAGLLALGDTIVCGDFNASAQVTPIAFRVFLDAVRDRQGLRSAYHAHRGIEPSVIEPPCPLKQSNIPKVLHN